MARALQLLLLAGHVQRTCRPTFVCQKKKKKKSIAYVRAIEGRHATPILNIARISACLLEQSDLVHLFHTSSTPYHSTLLIVDEHE